MHIQKHELASWLTLAHDAPIRIAKIQQLLAYFGSPSAICHASDHELRRHYLSDTQIAALRQRNEPLIETTSRWLDKSNDHHIIIWSDQRYPTLLSEISSPPLLLYAIGDPQLLAKPQIAMVGSRNPSHTGLTLAKEFAFQLSTEGLCITSGLALGIDAAAHQGALQASGSTIAVLGTGLQNIYPKRHLELAASIKQRGCIISEFPLNTQALPTNFPRRNRIISGLSVGTFVVEAAPRSGSLITAQHALEQGRDVFALPGSIRHSTALGCLQLIQQGAKCVITVHDILSEIHWRCTKPHKTSEPVENNEMIHSTLDPRELQVLACIENDGTTIDQICDHSKLSAQSVMVCLLTLELQGYVKSCRTGYTRVK